MVRILYEFDRDGIIYRGGLEFHKVRAYRARAESHCTVWHIEGAYDTLVEVEGSEWIAELTAAQPPDMRGSFTMHHYLIYLDSIGCMEIAAESWALLADEEVG